MADLSSIARKRHETLKHVLEVLGLDVPIPSTKVQPLISEAFLLDLLAVLAKRVVVLEQAHDADRIGRLEETVAALLKRRAPEAE